jgi:hypothetical protein
MAEDKSTYHQDQLLTKMECLHLFCEKLKIGKDSYYKYYRPFIKFKCIAQRVNKNGELVESIPRIPYNVAIGLINLLRGTPHPEDPPPERLKQFMDQVPENAK